MTFIYIFIKPTLYTLFLTIICIRINNLQCADNKLETQLVRERILHKNCISQSAFIAFAQSRH